MDNKAYTTSPEREGYINRTKEALEEEESDDEDDFTDESLSSKSDDNKSNSESRS